MIRNISFYLQHGQVSYGDGMAGVSKWKSTGELPRHPNDQSDQANNRKDPPVKDDGYAAQYNLKKDPKKVLYNYFIRYIYKNVCEYNY